MSTQAQPVSRQVIADDLRAALAGKLDANKVEVATKKILATDTGYSANGSVMSAIFYLKFQVNVSGGKQFNGKAGGLSTPGGGALFGTVYTDDINALYANTQTFEWQGTTGYLSIVFFDGNGSSLGNFQSGAVSTVVGIGGGKGSWE
jgi:hypothetical protein